MKERRFAGDQLDSSAELRRKGRIRSRAKYESYAVLADKYAPAGRWLDIGCGTGALIMAAQKIGKEIEGIELTTDRRELTKKLTGVKVYDRPIELLDLARESYAAVTLTDVFSHLTSPSETFLCIRSILRADGILLLFTSELGASVAKHHNYSWDLGSHLYYLGEHTIERYAEKLGFELVHREKKWAPESLYSRDRFLHMGRSALRNAIKVACVYTPGVFPLLKWYMLKVRHKDNPHYLSTLILKKVDKK